MSNTNTYYAEWSATDRLTAIATRLLGWESKPSRRGVMYRAYIAGSYIWISPGSFRRRCGEHNPGGWIGVINDAMRERGYYRTVRAGRECEVAYARGSREGGAAVGMSGSSAEATATECAALMALDAEEAATGRATATTPGEGSDG